MGLTVHHNLTTRVRKIEKIRKIIRQARELAMDLPFEQVGEIHEFDAAEIKRRLDNRGTDECWSVVNCLKYVHLPWAKDLSIGVYAENAVGFQLFPGPGCEDLKITLCRFPRQTSHPWRPRDDDRFAWDSSLRSE